MFAPQQISPTPQDNSGQATTFRTMGLLSALTPIHSDPSSKKPKGVALTDQGEHLIIVFQENQSPAIGGINGGFSVIDVTDPATPELIGETNVDQPREVVTRGNYAFVGGTANGCMRIVDITKKTDPQLRGVVFFGGQLFAIAVNDDGSRAYAAHTGNQGAVAIDTSDKANPAAMQADAASNFGAGNVRLDKQRDILFATDFGNGKLKAFDTTSNPILAPLGEIVLSVPQLLVYLTLDSENQLAFTGEFGGSQDRKIHMVDISDPSAMEVIDTFFINPDVGTSSLQAIKADSGQLYISHAEGGSNEAAYLSVLPYDREGFKELVPFFQPRFPFPAGTRQNAWKVQIGQTGDGPMDSFAVFGDFIYLLLLMANSERGALAVARQFDFGSA